MVITSGAPLAFIAYRDANDPTWHAATAKSPTKFTAAVHGPYWITAVCETAFDPGDGTLVTAREIWQAARTLDDAHDQEAEVCFASTHVTLHGVTGSMVQPGTVVLGDDFLGSARADWSFGLAEPKGTYTLYASTADRIAIRRGIAVRGRDVSLGAPIDVDREGAALSTVTFTASNARDGATLSAVVRIEQADSMFPGPLYSGRVEGAKVIPSAVLTANDNQTVSLREDLVSVADGVARTDERVLRKPFRVEDGLDFVVPAPITGVAWMQPDAGPLAVQWTALPPALVYIADVNGQAAGSPDPVDYLLDLSPAFLTATGATGATVDTQIPGFRPEWQIDYRLGYFRDVVAQSAAAGEHGPITTSSVADSVDPVTPVAIPAALVAPRRAVPPHTNGRRQAY